MYPCRNVLNDSILVMRMQTRGRRLRLLDNIITNRISSMKVLLQIPCSIRCSRNKHLDRHLLDSRTDRQHGPSRRIVATKKWLKITIALLLQIHDNISVSPRLHLLVPIHVTRRWSRHHYDEANGGHSRLRKGRQQLLHQGVILEIVLNGNVDHNRQYQDLLRLGE